MDYRRIGVKFALGRRRRFSTTQHPDRLGDRPGKQGLFLWGKATAIGLSPRGSIRVHIYTQTVHRTTQITTNLDECGPCPVFANFTQAFALQLRRKHGKTSVGIRKTSVSVRKPQSGYSILITKTPAHYKTYTHTHTRTHAHSQTHANKHYTHTHTHTLHNTPTHYIYIYGY